MRTNLLRVNGLWMVYVTMDFFFMTFFQKVENFTDLLAAAAYQNHNNIEITIEKQQFCFHENRLYAAGPLLRFLHALRLNPNKQTNKQKITTNPILVALQLFRKFLPFFNVIVKIYATFTLQNAIINLTAQANGSSLDLLHTSPFAFLFCRCSLCCYEVVVAL